MTRTALLSAEQCRTARALLDWTQDELAARADSTRMSVVQFEGGRTARASTRRRFREAFEQAGLRFIFDDPAGGEGVIRLAAAQVKPATRQYAFDREFYVNQAQLIASLARSPANRDIRVGLLGLAEEYQFRARILAGQASAT